MARWQPSDRRTSIKTSPMSGERRLCLAEMLVGLTASSDWGLGTGLLALSAYPLVKGAAYAVTVRVPESVLLITGIPGFCPPYVLFRVSTAEPKPVETDRVDGCCPSRIR